VSFLQKISSPVLNSAKVENSSYLIEYQNLKSKENFNFLYFFKQFDSCLPQSKLTQKYNSGADIADFYFFSLNKKKNSPENIFFNQSFSAQTIQPETKRQKYKNPAENNIGNLVSADWILYSLIISIGIFSLIKYVSKNLVSDIIQSVFYINPNLNKKAEIKSNFSGFSIVLNFFYFWNFSLFLYQAGSSYSLFYNSEHYFFIIFSIMFALFIIRLSRHILIYIPSAVFRKPNIYSELNRNIDIHNFILGFLFLFVISSAAFLRIVPLNISISAGFVLFFIIVTARIIKTTVIFLQQGVSFLHLFLYLCTLEILPLLILIFSVISLNDSGLKLDLLF
jgi:hypothetical protein